MKFSKESVQARASRSFDASNGAGNPGNFYTGKRGLGKLIDTSPRRDGEFYEEAGLRFKTRDGMKPDANFTI